MAQSRPNLFDPGAVSAHRKRARKDPVDFLRQEAINDIQERLIEVNKKFISPAIVTPRPDLWANIIENATFIADTDTLEISVDAHDLVIHDLCLHWANDPVGQMIQARRALRPDGLFIATLFGGQTLHELRTAMAEAEAKLTGGLSPRVAPMGDVRDLGGLLQRAGFALPVADALPFNTNYSSMLQLLRELRQMGETNALSERVTSFTSETFFKLAQDIYSKNFATADGRISATFEIITLTGWAPADTQPKPLRPGSATNRLADALGAKENKFKRF